MTKIEAAKCINYPQHTVLKKELLLWQTAQSAIQNPIKNVLNLDFDLMDFYCSRQCGQVRYQDKNEKHTTDIESQGPFKVHNQEVLVPNTNLNYQIF